MFTRRQIVALVLSLSYGLVAVAGHGLHALTPCGDAACHHASLACNCGCEHTHATDDAAPGDLPSMGRRGDSLHNSHACAVCSALAKVKVGHQRLGVQTLQLAVVAPPSFAPVVVALPDMHSAHSPRGPPALG